MGFGHTEDLAHGSSRVRRLKSNGILEPFQRTLHDKHFQLDGRQTRFETIGEILAVLEGYNTKRFHHGHG